MDGRDEAGNKTPMENGSPTGGEEMRRLQRLNRQMAAVFNSSGVYLALLDADFNFLMVNDAYAAGSGHSWEELIGRNHFDLFPDAENEAIFAAVRDTGRPYLVEEKPFTYADQPDRGVTYWNWSLFTVPDASGVPDSLLLSLTDVTAQVRARREAERLAEENRHQAAETEGLLASINDGLIVYDDRGAIVSMNEAAMSLPGYDEATVKLPLAERLKRTSLRTEDGKLLDENNAPVARAAAGETVRNLPLQFEDAAGRTKSIIANISPFNVDGRLKGVVVTVTDVTPMQEMQDRLREYLSFVAHDMRAPLLLVSGHARLLQEGLPGVPEHELATEHLAEIIKTTDRMNSMIEDVVEAARLEDARQKMEMRPLDLEGFLSALPAELNAGLDAVRRIRNKISTGLPQVLADRPSLKRIMNSLLNNALQYTSGRVTVTARELDGEVEISVRDEGRGILPKSLPRLFERFYRAETSAGISGLGLGLYIAEQLVKAQGGRIRAESRSGKGSVFSFTLPAAG